MYRILNDFDAPGPSHAGNRPREPVYNRGLAARFDRANTARKTMSQPHHTDPVEENLDSHPVKVAIGVAIGFAALIVGIILLTNLAIGAYGSRSMKDDPSMRAEKVEPRIAPVASVAVDPNAPVAPAGAVVVASAAPAPGPAAGAAAAPAAGAADAGKTTFEHVCTVCHSTGLAGAPKFGDKGAWAPRIATGKDKLYHAALNGLNAMPPKGGNPALSDADVKAAVDYMVSAAK
jgi:cytochrome c5